MNKQTHSPKSHRLPLWRRCVGYFTTLLMFLQVLVPSVASASALLTDDAIENALNNDPQFIKNTSGRFIATPFLTVSNRYYSIDNFYQCLFTNSKSSLVGPKMVPIGVGQIDIVIPTYERPSTMGSAFVQARYVRQQILGLLRRHLINSDTAAYASESRQLRTLYENACDYAQDNPGKKYGTRLELSREDAPKDMIWPELRTINGKSLLVPVVYLTADTIAKRRVVDQTTEFNGSAVFRAVDIEGSTLRFGRNGFLRVTDNIVNNGGRIVGADDLTLVAGGAFVNLSGVVQAEGDLTVVAQHIENRTLVHRYELGQAHERFGEIAETRSNTGDITFRSYGDIVFQSATANAQGNITFQADGNIEIGGQPIVNSTEGARDGWREYSASSVEYLQSRLSAGDTIRLIAGNEILIDGAELISARGHIELLAEMGITVQDQTNTTQYARKGKFGKTSVEESAYKTVAMRALLDAGKGITIHSEMGDITLKAADIRSQDGAQVTAQNGQVNLLVTTANDHYSYNSVKKSLFTTTTINRGHTIEDVLHTTVVGGLKVDALKGLNVEYRGQFDEQGKALDLDTQIKALGQMPGLEWMADVRAQHPGADWQAIEAKYEEWNEKNRSLSPAFAAVISIAVAIATQGIAANFASVVVGASQGAMHAAIMAGTASIISQSSLALANGIVNNDPVGAMESLASSDTLRSVAIAMVTAGAIDAIDADFFNTATASSESALFQGVTNAAGEVIDYTLSFQGQIAQALTHAAVQSGISTLINGGDWGDFGEQFTAAFAQYGINELGQSMAESIGKLAKAGDINQLVRYLAHAGSGCIIGTLSGANGDNGDDAESNCANGAGGAVVGELIADIYKSTEDYQKAQGELESWLKEEGDWPEGVSSIEQLTEEQRYSLENSIDFNEKLYPSVLSYKEAIEKIDELNQLGVNVSKLGAGIAAALAGGDVDIAATSAENAAENNAFFLLVPALKMVMTAITLHGIAETLKQLDKDVKRLNNADESERIAILGEIAFNIGLGIIENTAGGKAAKYGETILQAAKDKGLASDVIESLQNIANDLSSGRKVDARTHTTASGGSIPRGLRKPSIEKGKWEDGGTPGNSNWYSDDPRVNAVTGGKPVPFVNGYPDFSQWAVEQFRIQGMDGTSGDFSLAHEAVMKRFGLRNKSAARKYLRDNKLRAHHHENCLDIQLIPADLHDNVAHTGGAANLRNGTCP